MNYFDIKIRLFTANSVVLFEVQTVRIHMLKLEYFFCIVHEPVTLLESIPEGLGYTTREDEEMFAVSM